jgi:peptidylprolyl isomerase
VALLAAFLLPFGAVSPATAADPANTLVIELKTGKVTIELLDKLAPKHVARVKRLTRDGFYNGIVFHRVIAGFMAQSGDPTGTGRGGSKYPDLPAEFNSYAYKRGTVGAARTMDPNSANSQFFICFDDTGCRGLTGQYTVWGQVVAGMEHVDRIKPGVPGSGAVNNPDKIVRAYLASEPPRN